MMDLNEIIECASCEKEIYYGNSYASLFLTDVVSDDDVWLKSVPKRVCSECHEKELKQMRGIEERTKEAEERKHIESCENCRFRDDDKHEEPCRFCTVNKITMFAPRGNMDDIKHLISIIRDVLKDMEHLIKEIEEDGQTAGACGSDCRDNDRDRSCVCNDGGGE